MNLAVKGDNLVKYMPARKSKLPVSLRTHRDEANYLRAKKKRKSAPSLVEEAPLREWQSWKLIPNQFPYSMAFKVNHMLVPKRQVTDKELTSDERKELDNILGELNDQYDCLLVNFFKKQSIRNHFHIHLLTYKDSRKKVKV